MYTLAYRKINGVAKSIDPGQPAHSAHADMGRYFFQNPL